MLIYIRQDNQRQKVVMCVRKYCIIAFAFDVTFWPLPWTTTLPDVAATYNETNEANFNFLSTLIL